MPRRRLVLVMPRRRLLGKAGGSWEKMRGSVRTLILIRRAGAPPPPTLLSRLAPTPLSRLAPTPLSRLAPTPLSSLAMPPLCRRKSGCQPTVS